MNRSQRKARTTTTPAEQSVLAARIMLFFRAPDRSAERRRIVRQVLDLLKSQPRQWTGRDVRLWFNNNRRHYGDDVPREPFYDLRRLPPPVPLPPFDVNFQQRPLAYHPVGVPMMPLYFVQPQQMANGAVLPNAPPDGAACPIAIQYSPYPSFDPPRPPFSPQYQ
jgi:hypothetical protein